MQLVETQITVNSNELRGNTLSSMMGKMGIQQCYTYTCSRFENSPISEGMVPVRLLFLNTLRHIASHIMIYT